MGINNILHNAGTKTLLTVITLFGIGGYLLFRFVWTEYMPAYYWVIPVYYLVCTCVLQFFTAKSKENDMTVAFQMFFRLFKLIISLGIIIFYLAVIKTNGIFFVFTFGVFYIIYTLFETRFLMNKNLKKK